jgi:hypothetical protein
MPLPPPLAPLVPSRASAFMKAFMKAAGRVALAVPIDVSIRGAEDNSDTPDVSQSRERQENFSALLRAFR